MLSQQELHDAERDSELVALRVLTQEVAQIEEATIADVVAHWFTQGGKAEFGSHLMFDGREPKNADELVSVLLALVRPVAQENARLKAGWQPIETAPLDGTELLLWVPDDSCCLGTYVDFETLGGAPNGYHSGWYDNMTGHVELHPTHWMARPLAPSA